MRRPDEPPHEPPEPRRAPVWICRVVGLVALLSGVVLCLPFAVALVRVWGRPTDAGAFRVAGLVAAIGVFLGVVGIRLVTGRSRHRGSLLSRPMWVLLAVVFAGIAAFIATVSGASQPLLLLTSAFFGIGCLGRALRPRVR